MNRPIIFINQGNSDTVFLACIHARRTNPGREIILLGDASTRHYARLLGLTHIPMSTFAPQGERLAAVFTNHSSNGAQFELFCLQRWFLLSAFLETRPPEQRQCIHLDSDILAYTDLRELEQELEMHPMTMQECSGHSSFIRGGEGLKLFTEFIYRHYAEPALHALLLEETTRIRREAPGWNVSDMSFFLLFNRERPEILHNLRFPGERSYALDQTLDSGGEIYVMEQGIKALRWNDRVPYARIRESGRLVRFDTLHFQGRTKAHMYRLAKALRPADRLYHRANQMLVRLQKLRARLARVKTGRQA